jgi:hypothetical protein
MGGMLVLKRQMRRKSSLIISVRAVQDASSELQTSEKLEIVDANESTTTLQLTRGQ